MGSKPALRIINGSKSAKSAAGLNASLDWPLPARGGDGYLQIRISRNTMLALLASFLIHGLLLYLLVPHLLREKPLTAPQQDIIVRLNPPTPPQVASSAPTSEPAATPQPVPKPVTRPKPKVVTQPKPPPKAPDIIAVPESRSADNFKIPVKPAPITRPPAPATTLAPPTDMLAYVKANQARREAAESYAAHENAAAVAREHVPTEEEVRTANIKRNMEQGSNGIFQIMNKGARTAEFSFRGWTNDFSNSRREVIEVDAGPGGDINLAIVKRMIAVIRRDYSGDFNWESIRLNRVIILSARLDDNAGLEDFLMTEFFGTTAPAN